MPWTYSLAEGNVTGSTAMLTAIPEVDLGIECVKSAIHCPLDANARCPSSRLRNIEATEKAKRSLFEAEQRAAHQIGPTKAQAEADNYARQRFYHPEARDLSSGGGMPTRRSEKDYERDAAELLKKARAQAAARKEAGEEDTLLDEEVDEAEQHRRLVNELKSTDDQVVARFKTRQRENNAKQQRGIVWNR